MSNRILILLFLNAAGIAYAQLGYSEAALVKRLGIPQSTGKHSVLVADKVVALGPSLNFITDGRIIRCDLVSDRCVRVAYGKVGTMANDWSEIEVQNILNENRQGGKWAENLRNIGKSEKDTRSWQRSDGATATLSWFIGLSIASPEYQKARLAAGARPTPEGNAQPTKKFDRKQPSI